MFKNARMLFSAEEIEKRLGEIAAIIIPKIPSTATEIILVPIMDGAMPACRRFRMFVEEHFGGCGPCVGGPTILEKPITIKRSNGTELLKPRLIDFRQTKADFNGKFVVIIDDLVDEGETLKLAYKTIKDFNPAHLLSVVIVKKSNIATDSFIGFACFELGYSQKEAREKWLFGYGMDIDGKGREKEDISEITINSE